MDMVTDVGCSSAANVNIGNVIAKSQLGTIGKDPTPFEVDLIDSPRAVTKTVIRLNMMERARRSFYVIAKSPRLGAKCVYECVCVVQTHNIRYTHDLSTWVMSDSTVVSL